jgi:uncharacterized integral membrane protein
MKPLLWLLAIGLVLLLMFAILNWSLLTAPASLNFLLFTVEGPLGMILLGATLVLTALAGIYVLSLRTAMLLDMRRHTKELQAQRALADAAEASRFTELCARIDALERKLLEALGETANSLSAYVGEVDEKLDRLVAPAARG